MESSWSSVNSTNSARLGKNTAASTPSMSMSAMMSSGIQPGVVPSWPWNWRYLDTVQPSKPIVCSFLNSVWPPATIGSSRVNSSSHSARSRMLAGSRDLNRSGGSMMWQSPETRNSLYVAIGRPLL